MIAPSLLRESLALQLTSQDNNNIEIILDTETTGLSVKDGHRIVEIGCIELDNLIPTQKKFHCYLNPERKVSEKALEVHGYTDEFLSKKKKFSQVVDDFLNFINE